MTRFEFLQKLKQYIKEIDRFNSELKAKFPSCENNLEKHNFIIFSQDIKTDFLRKIEQYSKISDEEFNKINFLDFINKNSDTNFKSLEIHFKTLIKDSNYEYTPSDPNKNSLR